MENICKKPLIIFDCFGVIIKYDVSMVWLRKTFDDDTIAMIRKAYYPDADGGRISGKQLFEKLSYHSNISAEDIENELHALVEIDDDMINLVKKLKVNNYVALLSNCFSGFLDGILSEYKLNELFDCVVVSCDCNMIKPNRDIYEHMLSFFEGKCLGAIMIDDNKINLDGAINAGIENTILHIGSEDTAKRLEKLNIKI